MFIENFNLEGQDEKAVLDTAQNMRHKLNMSPIKKLMNGETISDKAMGRLTRRTLHELTPELIMVSAKYAYQTIIKLREKDSKK